MESKELDRLKNEYLNESMSDEALLKVRSRMADAKRDNKFEEKRKIRNTLTGIVASAAVVILCLTPFFGGNMIAVKSAAPVEMAMVQTAEASVTSTEEVYAEEAWVEEAYEESAVATETAEAYMMESEEATEAADEVLGDTNSATGYVPSENLKTAKLAETSESADGTGIAGSEYNSESQYVGKDSFTNDETVYEEAEDEVPGFDFDIVIFILEMIGTVAFAISGVMVAKEKKMDIFGAIVLGSATAVGGGVIRDLLLGQIPPVMFKEPIYVTVAAVTCILDFIIEKNRKTESLMASSLNQKILNAADSVGLAAFVVVGCRASINAGYNDHMLLSMFVGVLTGIGGGILRDILAGQMPLIMRKRVYGMAAVAGAVAFYVTDMYFNIIISAIISMTVVVLIRFLAIHFEWNLPSF